MSTRNQMRCCCELQNKKRRRCRRPYGQYQNLRCLIILRGLRTLSRRGFHGVHASCRPVGTYNSLPAGPGYHQTPLKSDDSPVACGVPLHQSGFTIAELTALVYPKTIIVGQRIPLSFWLPFFCSAQFSAPSRRFSP